MPLKHIKQDLYTMPPLPSHKCDNWNHCHTYVEKPGLCWNCKREAKRLTSKVKNIWKLIEKQKG